LFSFGVRTPKGETALGGKYRNRHGFSRAVRKLSKREMGAKTEYGFQLGKGKLGGEDGWGIPLERIRGCSKGSTVVVDSQKTKGRKHQTLQTVSSPPQRTEIRPQRLNKKETPNPGNHQILRRRGPRSLSGKSREKNFPRRSQEKIARDQCFFRNSTKPTQQKTTNKAGQFFVDPTAQRQGKPKTRPPPLQKKEDFFPS